MVNAGAIKCETVQDVVEKCDIILCCLSDGTAYKEVSICLLAIILPHLIGITFSMLVLSHTSNVRSY